MVWVEVLQKLQRSSEKVNNVDFEIKYGPRREGDLVETVLKDKSTYMTNLYSFEELLKI